MNQRKLLLIALLCLLTAVVKAQNTRLSDDNQIGWWNQFATITFNNKWSYHFEYQWRRDNWVKDWQQGLLRTGINYQLHKKVQLRVGYAWAQTFNYGDYPLQAAGKTFPEHRLFQMVTVSDGIGRLEISHRFMLEQRWIGRFLNTTATKADDFIFLNRMRYMFRAQCPLNKPKIEDKAWYAAGYDEVLIGFGKNVNQNVFDQNRLALIIGYRFNKTIRAEGGFFQQILQLGRQINNQNVFQYNNGTILNLYYNIDLSGKQ
jgi:hypothetical protein